MHLRGEAPTDSDVETYGKYFLRLLLNPDLWIRRQVESIRTIDQRTQEVRYSFDIDLLYVYQAAADSNVHVKDFLLIPLLILPKESIIDIDVVDQSEKSLNIIKRKENAFLSHAAWLASEKEAQVNLTSAHFSLFEKVFANENVPEENKIGDFPAPQGKLGLRYEDFDLVVSVPVEEISRRRMEESAYLGIIKMRHRFVQSGRGFSTWKKIPMLPILKHEWQIPDRSANLQTHMRFEIPEGLIPYGIHYVVKIFSLPQSSGKSEKSWRSRVRISRDRYSISKGIIAVHMESAKSGNGAPVSDSANGPDYTMSGGLSAKPFIEMRTRVSVPWLLSVLLPPLLSTIFLLYSSYLEFLDGVFTNQISYYFTSEKEALNPDSRPLFVEKSSSSGSSSALAILISIIPSIWGLYAVNKGEHFAFRGVVQKYRTSILISGFSLVLFGVVVSMGRPHEEIICWGIICSLMSLAFTLLIFVAFISSIFTFLVNRVRELLSP